MRRRFIVVAVLAVATALNYLAWLGWDQHKDVHPDGSETGPYQEWQVVGLIVVLGVLTAAGARLGQAVASVATVTVVMTLAFSVDAATDADADGLWAVGAIGVFAGTLVGTVLVAAVTSRSRRTGRTEPRAPQRRS